MRLKSAVLLCCALSLAAGPVVASDPYMVKDIDPLPVNQSSSPRELISLDNGITLFGANLSDDDVEMWRSDGTPGGTYQLTDTCTNWYCKTAILGLSPAGSRFFYFAATRPGEQNAAELWVTGGSAGDTLDLGGPLYPDRYQAPVWVKSRGILFFVATDITHGYELWRSDGTRAGTYPLTNVEANQVGSQPYSLTEHQGKLYFVLPGQRGWTLWTSDGTPKGTKLVKDVNPFGLRSIGSSLIFFGPGTKGYEIWRSDGTAKGTVKVASPLSQGTEIVEAVALGGRYYFSTSSPTDGEELWASNGTPAGTRRLTNFTNPQVFHYEDPDIWHPLYLPLLSAGPRMVFAADDGVHGAEPWVTDGTPAGTRLLRDVCPGTCWSWPTERKNLGNRLIFEAVTTTQGDEPWITDGTPAGTRLLRDICPGACHSYFFGMVPLGGGLLFGATDGQNGFQLWKTNGTPRGTVRITTFSADVSTVRRIGAPIPGGVLYSAESRQHGAELWRTDGTVEGTDMVLDLVDRDNGGGRPTDLLALGSRLLFLANDGVHGRELWTSDGTAPGTGLVVDNDPDATHDSDVLGHTELGGVSYLAWSTNGQTGLWRTDGTPAGTLRLTPDELQVSAEIKTVGNRLFFVAYKQEIGPKLWTSDGTVAGTRTLDVTPQSGAPQLTPYQGSLYFRSDTGEQVWKSNGTPEGTVPVPFLADANRPAGLLGEFGGRLWFGRSAQEAGYELWSTDGTEAGTRMLGDIVPGPDSFVVAQLFPAGARMFLRANNDLWVSDGTAAGTRNIGPGVSPDLTYAVLVNGRLYFSFGPAYPAELWVSDGTEAGTHPLRPASGERLEGPANLVAFEGRLWFLQGGKAWSTDGTPAGTVVELSFDPDTFTGEQLTPAGNRIFFSGWTPQTGHEIWAVDPE
jgi:ELWxxDGT repeat protein